MGPRTSPPASSYPTCSVCGNGGARYHYHGLVCQSCRVFFIRTVGQNKPLVCNRGGDCATLLGNSCNACAACRFKKCLEAKMDCSAVGRKRKPSACVNIITKTRVWKEQLQETLQPQANQWFVTIPGIGDVVDLALQLVKLEIDVNTLDNPTTSTENQDPFGYTPSVKLGSNNATCLIQKHPVSYFFQNAGIYMDNLRFCPEIKALDSNDKSTLIELNHHEFGLFSHKYYAWLAKTSFSSAFMAVNQNCQLRAESIEEIFNTCGLTDCEFVLLKIICLLSPAQTLSQDGHWYVVLARTRFISLLTDYSKKQHPELSADQQSLRIAKLVQTIAKVKEELTYSSRNMANIDVPRLSQTMRLSPTFSKYVSL